MPVVDYENLDYIECGCDLTEVKLAVVVVYVLFC